MWLKALGKGGKILLSNRVLGLDLKYVYNIIWVVFT